MFVAEHNLPLLIMDHLPNIWRSDVPDSNIAKNVRCRRTKTTTILREVIAPTNGQDISDDIILNNIPYSIIVESTDISTVKRMAIIVVGISAIGQSAGSICGNG